MPYIVGAFSGSDRFLINVRVGIGPDSYTHQGDALTLAKDIRVTPKTFAQITALLQRFDDLCNQIRAEHPEVPQEKPTK